MYGYNFRYRLLILVFVFIFAGSVLAAKTWKIGQGQDWSLVSDSPKDEYQLIVKRIKEFVDKGQGQLIGPEVARLKSDFPEMAGPDLDAFIEGETAYAEGKFVKAVRAYDAFMKKYPNSRFYEAALEREFSIAQAYLGGHKKRVLKVFKIKGYAQGVKVMENVIDRAGNSPLAVKASVAIAESFEKRSKYADAYEQWSRISSNWPTGQTGKTALLAMARCKHAAYRGPKYDVSDLVSAKSYYENFRLRYPKEAGKYEIDKRLAQIDEQIAYKEYRVASYYHRTGSNKCADFYCDMVQQNWPVSTAAKRAESIAEEISNAPAKEDESEKEKKWNVKKLLLP